MKREYTPAEVARICNVHERCVCRWFDSGRLPGYRLLGNRHRRIPHDDLVRSLMEHNLPMIGLEKEAGSWRTRDRLRATVLRSPLGADRMETVRGLKTCCD